MHFIRSNAVEIKELNPYKKVEKIGRICYKSEDKITDESYETFVTNLIKRQHFAMLEHARLFFEVSLKDMGDETGLERCRRILDDLCNIPAVYTHCTGCDDTVYLGIDVSLSHLYNPRWSDGETCSANAGTLFEAFKFIVEREYSFKDYDEYDAYNLWELYGIDLDDIQYHDSEFSSSDYYPMAYDTGNMKFVSIKFSCSRGVSHELVRHRCAVAESSTRYCNYSKDKFGNGDIAFVYPHDYNSWDKDVKLLFERNLKECEDTYNYMIGENMSPQQARAILPNALAIEVVLTMNLYQWEHFLNLRCKGTTGAPHPDMKDVAAVAESIMIEYFNDYNRC